MAKCTYTQAVEFEIKRKMRKLERCMTLDTFNKEAATEGIKNAKRAVSSVIHMIPGLKEQLEQNPDALTDSEKKTLRRFHHIDRMKFKMGDYTEVMLKHIEEMRELVMELRNHDCGPVDHPENRPE